jgi:hypothetical protein
MSNSEHSSSASIVYHIGFVHTAIDDYSSSAA